MIPDYEGMLERWYRSRLRPGDVCVDVGAHLGRHAVPMAIAVGDTGRVYAFEPIPAVNQRLRELVAALPARPAHAEIRTFELALGEAEGVAEFVVVREFPEYSGFRERVYHDQVTTDRIEVRVARLDAVLADAPRVRYVKIDAEGGEFTILRGADGLIRRDRPLVSFECGDNSLLHYPHAAADLFDLFTGWDYSIADLEGVPLDRAGFVESSSRQAIWDYIATPL